MSLVIPGFRALPLPIAQLSLSAVSRCGQSFRWSIHPLLPDVAPPHPATLPSHEYRLCLKDRVVCLRQTSDTLFYKACFPSLALTPEAEVIKAAETLKWLEDYFQLDVDLLKLYEDWASRDPVFARLRDRFSGIRMLRQDPFENLCSFICSSNNNISRITGMVKNLCKHFSPVLMSTPPPPLAPSEAMEPAPPEAYHPFPSPAALAAPGVSTTLRKLGFGYRADFIHRTAQMLVERHSSGEPSVDPSFAAETWLHSLRERSTAEARDELLKFVGVGHKVADCILLMSLDKREVIPVDTHVHQVAIKYYGLKGTGKANMTPKLYNDINVKLAGIWGDYAGWAQTVLFTADLKAFASYGLPISISDPMTAGANKISNGLSSPAPSAHGRKRSRIQMSESYRDSEGPAEADGDEHYEKSSDATLSLHGELSLADRVKKRARVNTKAGASR